APSPVQHAYLAFLASEQSLLWTERESRMIQARAYLTLARCEGVLRLSRERAQSTMQGSETHPFEAIEAQVMMLQAREEYRNAKQRYSQFSGASGVVMAGASIAHEPDIERELRRVADRLAAGTVAGAVSSSMEHLSMYPKSGGSEAAAKMKDLQTK